MKKPLYWYNDTVLETVRGWTEDVQKDLGHQLRDVQSGEFPDRAKWLKGVGEKVLQIKYKGARCVATLAMDDEVWVVHAFLKDAREGSETRRHLLDLIRQRVDELLTRNRRRH